MPPQRRGDRRTGVRRDHHVKLSLSAEEHELLSRAATDHDMTLGGFAAHACLGVARTTLETTPGRREAMIALNDGIIALDALAERLHADGTTPELLQRAATAIGTLEDACEALQKSARP
ncbi:hypothetical protein J0910_02985 [Nocardiopsis sp. CNT-189]|uniref:hypothetical protein n=1 Tax=Nocardiopsis oceanisediminis TaxID=2816862 RepID=UPI003B2AD7CF